MSRAEHAAIVFFRFAAGDCRPAQARSQEADEIGVGRPGLDRHEVPGQGAGAALRECRQPGARHPVFPDESAGGGAGPANYDDGASHVARAPAYPEGGSDWVGASGRRNGSFWNAWTTPTKTFK